MVVGVNRFRSPETEQIPRFQLDPGLEQRQIRRLEEARALRNKRLVTDRLNALEEAARGTENLMPHIVRCAEAFATVGEISDRLRKVFGEYRER